MQINLKSFVRLKLGFWINLEFSNALINSCLDIPIEFSNALINLGFGTNLNLAMFLND
jgi:hypothetical protein